MTGLSERLHLQAEQRLPNVIATFSLELPKSTFTCAEGGIAASSAQK
jgi:hypothetical protein